MLTKVDARRRWFGLLFLIFAAGMLAWGLTFLKSWLMQRPFIFLFYWLVCFGFTGLALLVAALDMIIVRQRTREEKRKLLDASFREDSVKRRSEERNS